MSTNTGGRPAIGPKVPINFPEGLLQDIDQTAERAGLSRAAWIRKACARALPETYEGAITPAQISPFLGGSLKGTDLDHPDRDVHVDAETKQRLIQAAENESLTVYHATTESLSSESPTGLRRLSFTTRKFKAGNESITIFQVTFTRQHSAAPGGEGTYQNLRWLFTDQSAARTWHEECREERMHGA